MAWSRSVVVIACAAVAAMRQVPRETPKFRVAVDVVSIDAVVTDRNGDVVPDLTAADFEILQDGKRQKVTFAQFVPVMAGPPPANRGNASTDGRAPAAPVPPTPAAPIARQEVARTIVLLVDDLGLSVTGLSNVRKALHGFVETGLLPTDLVAIVRTGESRGALQSFTNDRSALSAAIDALRFNVMSRKGVWPSEDVTQVGGGVTEMVEPVSSTERYISNLASLSALNMVVQVARDLPGRRAVIVASEGFDLWIEESLDRPARTPTVRGGDTRVHAAVNRLIDQAARSGVVIYTIDGRALETSGLKASDDFHQTADERNPFVPSWMKGRDAVTATTGVLAAKRLADIQDAQNSLEYLAEHTGGFAVLDTNDLARGLSRISNDVRDYYVIGYEPDRDTFGPKGQPPRLHTIEVNVKRAGVRVRTRREFIGVPDAERASAAPTPAQQLVRAAISPFSADAVALRATNLPGYAPGRGMFVRTVLHIDARALTFSTNASDARTASADLVGLVFNSDGVQVDTIGTGFDVTLTDEAAARTVRDGLVYTTRVPIAKPGGYQLRYALRDRRSGALGSVGGFVSVPDVAGGAFALSGLVLRASRASAETERIDSDRFSVPAADALRIYSRGQTLSYSYELYNAGTAAQAVTSLWRGTDRLLSQPPQTLVPPPHGGPAPAGGELRLADDLPAGTYVLQVIATSADPRQPKRIRSAAQRLSFDVK